MTLTNFLALKNIIFNKYISFMQYIMNLLLLFVNELICQYDNIS